MKKSELIFNLASIPLDAGMIVLAGLASFFLRLHTTKYVGPVIYDLRLGSFLPLILEVLPVLLLLFAALGLYNLRGVRKLSTEFGKIFIGVSGGLFFVIIAFFFNQSFFPSRFIILVAWAFAIVFVAAGRLIVRLIQAELFKKGYGLHRLIVVDGNARESRAVDRIFKNKRYGYEVIADVDYNTQGLAYLEKLCADFRVDEILQANPKLGEKANLELLQFAKHKGLSFSFVPNLFEVQRNVVEMSDYKGVPVISLKNSPLDGWGKVSKRMLDFVSSICSIVISGPLFIVISIAIKMDSSGPVIYTAPRAGFGRQFKFYKFRTMYSHLSVGEGFGGAAAEQFRKELWQKNERGSPEAPVLKIKDDPRVTPVGKFLRRNKLDEIPQFWNVLAGHMSMVGPRAHVLDEVERYRTSHNRMFSIKPGIFGLAQLAQVFRPNLPFEEEARLNVYYIENWSLWLDLKILAKSFILLLFGTKPKDNY